MTSTGTATLTDAATGKTASKTASFLVRQPAQWGLTWIGLPGATVTDITTGISSFQATTSRKATIRKVYYGQSDGTGNVKYFPTALSQDPYLQVAKIRGDTVVVCLRPYCDATTGQGTAADAAAITACLRALIAAGLTVVCCLHQECQDHLSAAAYKANVAYYAAAVAAAGVRLAYDAAGHTGAAKWAEYDPGGQLIQLYLLDLYGNSFLNGNDPAPFIAQAHVAGRPWGMGEIGACVGSEPPPSLAGMQQFLGRLASLARTDQNAGRPVYMAAWYLQPSKNPNNDPAPYVPLIQALADTLTLAA